jgi:hypothetical protein
MEWIETEASWLLNGFFLDVSRIDPACLGHFAEQIIIVETSVVGRWVFIKDFTITTHAGITLADKLSFHACPKILNTLLMHRLAR